MKTVNEKFKTLMSDYFWNHVMETLLKDDPEFQKLSKESEELSHTLLKKYGREIWNEFDDLSCIQSEVMNKFLEAAYIHGVLDSKELFSDISE